MKFRERRFPRLVIGSSIACLLYTSSAFCASIPLNGPENIIPPFANEKPTVLDMALDAVIGRPLLLATTTVGAAMFVVSLPFSIATHQVGDAAYAFVAEPAKATFNRCLGCHFNMASGDVMTYPSVGA